MSPIESISYDALRARVVADLGRVARDREHVAHALGMRPEELRLDPEHRRVARRQVRDRLEARRPLDRARDHEGADPGPRCRVVVHVDEADEHPRPRARAPPRAGRARTLRAGVELHRDDELALAQRRAEPRLELLLAERDRDLRARRACSRARTGRSASIAALIAAISVGVVPQQPPITRAPRSRACAANSAK